MVVKQEPTGWVGWIYFASVLLMLTGALHILAGLTGIFNSDFYVAVNGQLLVFGYMSWGWAHLLIGAAALGIGVGLATGRYWARIAGMAIVVVSIVANVAFLPVYPWWSTIALIVDALVLYAIALHSDEVR